MTRILYLLAAVVLLAAGVATAALANGHPSDNCKYKHDCETTTTTPPPTQTTPPPTTTTPPPAHNCQYTGAGKDGQPGNDDCASVPPKTSTTPAPPQPPITQTVTVTVPTPPTVITKTVVKYKTRVVYHTKYKNKIVRKTIILRRTCGCPVGTRLYHGKCHPTIPGKG